MIKLKGKAFWGGQMFGGYPGLAFTSFQISEYIPRVKIYCEPFAGMGRLTNYIKANKIILNDKSEYAFNHLKTNFKDHIITNDSFEKTIMDNDSEDTFFLIDPPWYFEAYDKNKKAYCDRQPKEYYDKILELLKDSKSYWFVCCASDMNLKGYDGFENIIITGNINKKIFGHVAKTKIYSNKPFIRYNQMTL